MSPAAHVPHRQRLAPRALTLMYLAFAYLCLAVAFATLIVVPQAVGGFFYHGKMLAVVHLVTLGWVTASILGYFHLVGPVALRNTLRAGAGDYLAWLLVVVGITGLVTHFWIDEYSGMVWSAGSLLLGVAWVGARGARMAWSSKIQTGVKLHITLAFMNLVGAGVLGMLIGIEKQLVHVLPGYVLSHVYAHAHLAALGWATMMVMGIGYRLFPMVLPAAMPSPSRTWQSALLLEVGLLGLLLSLPLGSPTGVRAATALVLAGLGAFFAQVVWMKRRPKPRPKDLPWPDFGTLHVMQGVGYMLVSAALGAAFAFAPAGAWKLQAAMAYGVFALVGFLAQIVVGFAARILPMFSWTHYYVGSEFKSVPPSQYRMHNRRLQALGFVAWTVGVPVLAWGLSFNRWSLVSAGAAALLLAIACNGANTIMVARVAFAYPAAAERR